jgi:transposase
MFTKQDEIVASVSFDDRYYTSPECAECGVELYARTMADLEAQMRDHACAFVID